MKIRVWCEETNTPLRDLDANKRMPSLVRCPKCKQRFSPIVYECDDLNCYHACLPKHKKTIKL